MQIIPIYGDHIALGQLLKLAGIVASGGEVKLFLTATSIKVNNEHDNRRGRKLFPGDIVTVEGHEPILIAATIDAGAVGNEPGNTQTA